MIKKIRVIDDNRTFEKQINSNDDLSVYCKDLSIYISSSYMKRTALKVLKQNFFYFSPEEQRQILNYAAEDFDCAVTNAYIYKKLMEWFSDNSSLNLNGFVVFRLKEYADYIEFLVEEAVGRFIVNIKRECLIDYFKELLKQQIPYIDTVYVYSKNGSYNILNDKKEKILTINDCDELFLNIMVSLAPSNIYFYGMCSNAAFFDTFKSVFENRVKLVN